MGNVCKTLKDCEVRSVFKPRKTVELNHALPPVGSWIEMHLSRERQQMIDRCLETDMMILLYDAYAVDALLLHDHVGDILTLAAERMDERECIVRLRALYCQRERWIKS